MGYGKTGGLTDAQAALLTSAVQPSTAPILTGTNFTGVPAAGVTGLGTAAAEDVAAGGSGDLLRADGDGSSLTGITASPSVRKAYLDDADLSSTTGTDTANNGTITQEVGYKTFYVGAGAAGRWTHNDRSGPRRDYVAPDGDFFAYMLVQYQGAQANYKGAFIGMTSSTVGLENYWFMAGNGSAAAQAGYHFIWLDGGAGASSASITNHANTYRWIGVARMGNIMYAMQSANGTGDEPGPNDWAAIGSQACTPGAYFAGLYDTITVVASDEGTATEIDVDISDVVIKRL